MKKTIKRIIVLFISLLLVAIIVIKFDDIYYKIDATNNIKIIVSKELISVSADEINDRVNGHYLFYNEAFQSNETKKYDYYLCLVEVINNSNCQCVSNVYFKQREIDNTYIQSRIDIFDAYTILPHSKEVIPIGIQVKKQDNKESIKSILEEIPKKIYLDLTKSRNNENELDYSCSISKSFSETEEDFSKKSISFPVIY